LEETKILKDLLGSEFVTSNHIGSTSVKNLLSKPNTDIALEVRNLDDIVVKIENAGYTYKGELNIPFRHFFSKNTDDRHINLHVTEEGNPEVIGFLLFRNYIEDHKEAMDKYIELKKSIAKNNAPKKGQLLGDYTLAKDDFIRKILKKAGFEGLCMRYVTHYNERKYADKYKSVYECMELVFYKGPQIIGYCGINQNLDIEIFEIEEKQYENHFRAKIERLINQKKRTKLTTRIVHNIDYLNIVCFARV
jgi:GrpB-like predicted nucleotidyltransferase (UPF0157 family)